MSIETVNTLLASLESTSQQSTEDIATVLTDKQVRYVTYADWKVIDEYEVSEGQKKVSHAKN